jgi:hypothetical protein
MCNPDTALCEEADPCGGCLAGQYCNEVTMMCEGL